MSLAKRIEQARLAKGLSKRKLEQAAGLSKGYLSRLAKGERGKRSGPDTLGALARVLGVRYEWLAKGEGEMRAAISEFDAFPNRAEAARIARADGGIAGEAIDAVLAETPDFATDPSVLWWLDRIRLTEVLLRRRVPHEPKRPEHPQNGGARERAARY